LWPFSDNIKEQSQNLYVRKWHADSYFDRIDERLRVLGDDVERCKSFRNIMMAATVLIL
jgi:hypothetical protein